ncbi:MAG: long-chain-acyl-CoA synthetase [Gammaproteobacteria bacterium]|nr:long-chain-acyl-CoA synthetase [Gammaproteobacteria bacterium]
MLNQLAEVRRVTRDFVSIFPTLAFFKQPGNDEKKSLGRMFQQTAANYPGKSAIVFEGGELNWREFNALANQFAHALKRLGVARGDTVALLMENRIEMLACIVALAKLGAVAGLINTSLSGRPLVHCITTVESKKCIVGEELLGSIVEVQEELGLKPGDFLWVADRALDERNDQGQFINDSRAPDWAVDLSAILPDMPDTNLPETDDIRAGEKALYIFTSGTTGLPKAAVIYHRRYLSAATPYSKIALRAKPDDRIYVCLPLYHITGLGPGVGASFHSGASIFLRRRFSASRFWPEVQQYQTNLFVYVGELCRYLALQPECPEEKNNPIETMLGNGLRPDVWDAFRTRFKVNRISEIYGASEGNVGFINVLNKDRTIGTTSAEIRLIKYDVDTDEMVRDRKGRLLQAKKGEPGLLLGKIDAKYQFDGYLDKDASESKILHDVVKPGDRWFNTGDLVRQIDVGFALGLPHYQFVDRVGDTFRWRAENVSTNEVGEIINGFEQVDMANVYGVEVPGAEGKAGMAALTLHPGVEFDPVAFSEFAQRELSAFSRPVFLRLQQAAETTGTFKLLKGNLRKESYHLDQVSEPIYVLKPRSKVYEPLQQDFYNKIIAGEGGY